MELEDTHGILILLLHMFFPILSQQMKISLSVRPMQAILFDSHCSRILVKVATKLCNVHVQNVISLQSKISQGQF